MTKHNKYPRIAGLLAVVVVGASACSPQAGVIGTGPAGLGDEDQNEDEDDGWPPDDDDDGPSDSASESESESTTGEPEGDEDPGETGEPPMPMPPDVGMCNGDEDCMHEDDGTCFVPQGTCEFGECFFDTKAEGESCDDGNACTERDACNVEGACVGVALECPFPNGQGVCAEAGTCSGPIQCDAGFADCNGEADDGCEVELGTTQACGGCGDVCSGGDNVASVACVEGACVAECEGPYEDCDGDPSNGCEIPTGIPNQCDSNGLNPDGCWSAHCGSSANADAVNFGAWFCFECTNCQPTTAGNVHWCSHSTGRWFPDNAGTCEVDGTDYTNLVCEP